MNKTDSQVAASRNLREFADRVVWLLGSDQETRDYAEIHLKSGGFRNFAVFDECEACIQSFKSGPYPDLIVLDLDKPDSGLDLLKHLRLDNSGHRVPIIVATGIEEPQIRDQAFQLGASGIISKPFDGLTLTEQARSLVKASQLTRELEEYKNRVSEELKVAKRLQQSLQPSYREIEECRNRTGLDISSAMHSSSELSGDFWGIKEITDSKLVFYIVDLVGHGIAAAANTFRFHEILSNEEVRSSNLAEFLHRVNQRFHKRTPPDVFASILVGAIDLKEQKFHYVSAMATSPILWREGAHAPLMLFSGGVPVGVTAEPDYQEHKLPFLPGDRLFFYSDALVEADAREGGVMGHLTPCDMMAKALAQKERSVLGAIEEYFCQETQGPLRDDLTLLLISSSKETPPRS